MLDAEAIDAAGNAVSKLDILELFLIGAMILTGLFLIKNLPKIIDGRFVKLKDENKRFEAETDHLVKNIGETVKRFEENQIKLAGEINGLIESDVKNRMRTKDVLKLIIYGENLPVLDRMEAAHDYPYLGGNGPAKDYVITKIIIDNKGLWESVRQRKREGLSDYDPKKNYEQAPAEIEIKTALA